MNREVTEVSIYLRTKSIQIPPTNEWLTSCVECFKEQGNITSDELKEQVYQQWLLADLSDIGAQVIPNEIISSDKYTLNGKYAVQLNYLVNVAVSFHKQLQKIRRPDVMKNLEVDSEFPSTGPHKKEESGTRMLKIEITDGVVKFYAFEDQIIPSLKENVLPGIKAVLAGPIEFRKSVAFLKPRNIFLLGGEVDTLIIPNAVENILARSLKVPENPDPYSRNLVHGTQISQSVVSQEVACFDDDDADLLMLAEDVEKNVPDKSSSVVVPTSSFSTLPGGWSNAGRNTQNSMNPISNSNAPLNNLKPSVNPKSGSSTLANVTSDSKNVKPESSSIFRIPQNENIDFDDDFDFIAAETVASIETSQPRGIDSLASELKAYEVFDSTNVKKEIEKITDLKQKLSESYCEKSPPHRALSNYQPFTSSGNGKIAMDCLSQDVSEMEDPPPDSLQDTNNFIIEPFPPRKRPATVSVFARVIRALRKPKIKDEKWSVSALVEAKGIELEVSFESQVVDKIFRIPAAKIVASRNDLTSDPIKKQEMNEALKEAHTRFNKLACLMTFNFKDSISDPIIIDVVMDR